MFFKKNLFLILFQLKCPGVKSFYNYDTLKNKNLVKNYFQKYSLNIKIAQVTGLSKQFYRKGHPK